MTMTQDMILFVIQNNNDRKPRTILVPMKEFLSVRNNDYEILKKHAEQNVKFTKHSQDV